MARILIVESDESVAKLFNTVLFIEGHEVTVAATPGAAVQAFYGQQPQLLIVSRNQFGTTVGELLGELTLTAANDLAVIVIGSGKPAPTDEAMERMSRAGMDRYLTKPVALEKLVRTVDELLRG